MIGAFEQRLSQEIFAGQSEKTFIDKMLAREDVERIREIIKLPRLSREDLAELLYLLTSAESKLVNYSAWERYVILKYYVWVREFVKSGILLRDYIESLYLKEKSCKCGGYRNLEKKDSSYLTQRKLTKCECSEEDFKPVIVISERAKKLLDNNDRLMEQNIKFLVDLYLNIARTSLSLGATGLMELLKNKYEIVYPQGGLTQPTEEKKEWGLFKR